MDFNMCLRNNCTFNLPNVFRFYLTRSWNWWFWTCLQYHFGCNATASGMFDSLLTIYDIPSWRKTNYRILVKTMLWLNRHSRSKLFSFKIISCRIGFLSLEFKLYMAYLFFVTIAAHARQWLDLLSFDGVANVFNSTLSFRHHLFTNCLIW